MQKSLSKETRSLLTARALSMVGSSALPIAFTFAILKSGGDALQVGVVLGLADLPFVLLLLVGGVIADRHERRFIALFSDIVRATVALVSASMILLHLNTVVNLSVLAVVWGSARAFFVPTVTGLIPEITPVDQLHRINSLVGASVSLGTLIGPAIGGLVVATIGPGEGALFATLAYIGSSIYLSRIHPSDLPENEFVSPISRGSFLSEIKGGYKAVRSKSWAFWTIVVFGVMHLTTFGPLFVVGPVIAAHSLGGAAAWGYIVAADGGGAIFGSLIAMRRPPQRPLYIASILMLLGVPSLILLALHVDLLVILGSFAIFGVATGYFGSVWDTLLQKSYPIDQISKVSSYDYMGSTSLLPLGEALGGGVAGAIGNSMVLIIGGVALFLLSLTLILMPSARNARPPHPGDIA